MGQQVAAVRFMSRWTRGALCDLPSGTPGHVRDEGEVDAWLYWEVTGKRLGVNRVLEDTDNGGPTDQ